MSASITAPRGLQTLNPSPEISRYYNKVDAPYINTAQVLSEVLLPVRYPGQTFLVVDEEWWFKSGKLDADLVLKQDSGTGITDLDYTPSPTQGTVTSSTGTDAIISLADNTNAGLMSPSDKYTLYDNVIYRSGTEVGKPMNGTFEIADEFEVGFKQIVQDDSIENVMQFNKDEGIFYQSYLYDNLTDKNIQNRSNISVSPLSTSLQSADEITGYATNFSVQADKVIIQTTDPLSKGFVGTDLYDKQDDLNAFAQLGDLTPLENDIFELQLANTGDETAASIQAKRPLKTVNGNSLEGSGNIVIAGGGGAVDSVNGQTGVVVLDADDIDETATRVYVTPSEKTAITHSNRSILDNITEAFTTGLKTSYDSAVTWISTNGTNLLNHLLRTDNPHSVTKIQVGLGNSDDTSDINKPISTATQTALDLKQPTLTDTNFGTFTNSVGNKETQANTDILGYIDVTTGKWVKQTFSKLVDYLKGFFQTSRIIVTSNVTAVNGSVYHNNGNNTFADPTPENNRGFYVLNVSGSPTIGGNAYSVGTYIFRYYDGTNWINNTIKKGVSNAVYSANKTLTPLDNQDTIFMDSGTLTVNPTAQAYQNGYTIAVASSGGSNTSLVLQSATDWSYVINANASIASGSVFIEKGGTATIVRKANLKIFQINGSVI